MHAAVVKVTIDDLEPASEFLTNEVVPRVSSAPGFVAGYWTRSEAGDNGLSMIIFESEEAAQTAREQLQQVEPHGITIDSVEVREVVANA